MSLHHAEIIHGSQPNNSNNRRIGYAMQAYMPAHAQQTVGENIWLNIRGQNHRHNSMSLSRPQGDMDPTGVLNRKRVNDNWANILYQGAEKQRAY